MILSAVAFAASRGPFLKSYLGSEKESSRELSRRRLGHPAADTGVSVMPEGLKGCRILILEDEYFIGADLKDALRAAGADVLGPFAKAKEARSLIAGHACHAAVLDIKLADENVYATADELVRRRIPFVLATGYGAEYIPDRFRTVLRWEKPYNIEDAVRDLAHLLRGS